MKLIDYYSIIRSHFPNTTDDEIKQLSGGNDHVVFLVKNLVCFRFSKNNKKADYRRKMFLDAIANDSPILVPTVSIFENSSYGITYEIVDYISGVSFYPEVSKSFSKNELLDIAKKLGEFFSYLHGYSVSQARIWELDEMNPNDFGDYMENNPNAYPRLKSVVFPFISNDEREWIEQLFYNYISLVKKKKFPVVVTHSDMWTYHIIVDENKHNLNGIIDFWGRIADPAKDFKAFEYYGKDFVDEVYNNYTGQIDDNFDKRRLFYTGYDEVFEMARSIENGDSELIEKQRNSL